MVLGITPRGQVKDVTANPLAVNTLGRTKAQITWDIARTIYVRDGLRGFYRGYVASLCTYVPSSACWWTFYSSYQEIGAAVSPGWAPHTLVQCAAAVMSGQRSIIVFMLAPGNLSENRPPLKLFKEHKSLVTGQNSKIRSLFPGATYKFEYLSYILFHLSPVSSI